jgi:hypothetical protein
MAACGCPLNEKDVHRISRRIETELPVGSNKAQVTKFLDDMHIQHGCCLEIYDTDRYNKLEQIKGNVYGFGEPAGRLIFFFQEGKLVEWWVESDCGGGCYSMRGGKPTYRRGVAHECYDP